MNISFDIVFNVGHLNLIVNDISGEIPKLLDFLFALEKLVELTQRQLPEIVVVQF